MAEPTSDAVSLADIESELEKVQAEKAAQEEKHRAAIARLEQHELQLLSAAHALRDFIEYRRTRMTEPDILAVDNKGRVSLVQVKSSTIDSPNGGGIVERAIAALANRGELTDTWPLIATMQESGYTTTASDVYLTVYGSINRAAKKPNSRIVKVGSQWGLREWFPEGLPEAKPKAELNTSAFD